MSLKAAGSQLSPGKDQKSERLSCLQELAYKAEVGIFHVHPELDMAHQEYQACSWLYGSVVL